MKITTDIDLDMSDRKAALSLIPHIPAMLVGKTACEQHNTGVYLQNIPVLPSGIASLEYKTAERLGYFKLDFLNNSIYTGIRDRAHLVALAEREPHWELLESEEIVGMLAHIRDHFDVVRVIQPKSVIDLAVVLALIRPGKRHLLHRPRAEIDAVVWEKPLDGSYYFKKAHAVAFSLSIVVQLNKLVEDLGDD